MDDPGPAGTSVIVKIILLFVLILVNAFFAMSEIAIISLNDNKVEKMANEGNKKAKKIVKLTENSSSFLSTIQIGVTLAGFLTSASASQSFAGMLASGLCGTWVKNVFSVSFIRSVSVVLITIVMSYFSLVLGELVPKRIAMNCPEKVSFKVVGVLQAVAVIAKPFVKILSLSTNGIVRLFGIDPNANDEPVTEEEIRMMVDVGGERGVIEDVQKEMINNIFEFDDIDVGDIMTHRTEMTAVEADTPMNELISMAVEDGYSRIPVYDEDPDNIIGIIYIKDLLKYIGTSLPEGQTLRDFMREAYYVPETKRCGELFKEMTGKKIQIAVVVDEYGGTAGIVTMEDLLESIVGNIQDEYDNEEEEISKINETTFTIDGATNIDELDELVGTTLPEGDYDTVAGFVISLLGYLPKPGETPEIMYENLKFNVLEVEDRRIVKVRVEILPVENNGEKDPE
ncbi:MAG: hemolysin family protein [Clostridiales bacterium]|nr:hemolysin family protein [Clostridiales bacterium]